MVRSLYSGISGLRSHQVALDVTGNNISNVNTVGFKSGRATFKESMAQMLQGPSRPAGNYGGTNPLQVGLGTSIGSIDTMLRQGNLQTTGQITDLAIEGRGYFAFSSGASTFYSRNGGLHLDATGRLVSPTNGWALQGKMADALGNYPAGTVIGDITIPWGEKAPAKATTQIDFACNLNMNSEPLGTVTHTNTFLTGAGVAVDGYVHRADPNNPGYFFFINTDTNEAVSLREDSPGQWVDRNGTLVIGDTAGTLGDDFVRDMRNNRDLMTNLFDSSGNSLGIKVGDRLSVAWSDGEQSMNFFVEKESTLDDFISSLESYLNRLVAETTGGSGSISVSMNAVTGEIDIVNRSNVAINGLSIKSDRAAGSNSFIANALGFGQTIPAAVDDPEGAPGDLIYGTATSRSAILIPAAATDRLADIRDAAGEQLGLEGADPININGSVGGRSASGGLTYHSDMTMQDLINELMSSLGLPPTDDTIHNRPSISIKQQHEANDGIPLGAIVIRGQPEVAFALTKLSVRAEDSNRETPSPTRFNMNMAFTEVQTARNTGVHDTSLIVYDDSGAPHNVTMTFSHTGVPNEWIWEIAVAGDQQVISGDRGRLVFGLDGTPAAFTYDDDSGSFRFEPMNGASQLSIDLNAGGPGSLLGITQFESPTTTVARDQNGYPMGKLQEISIDEKGEISGVYTNGVSKAIAQIFVAEFNNPAGLLKMGDSMYAESNNSGYPVMFQPVVGTATKIKPGALEMSNVELETEFTNMITIQRGYQANARVITTSDQVLQELVNIVR